MLADKVKKFMCLGGQGVSQTFCTGSEVDRKLGAQLLLSEVLEYVIDGLGVIPEVNGVKITEPDSLNYHIAEKAPDRVEMLDGLSDVAYTMYWNALKFGIPLEEGYDLVCDNNLEKFVKLSGSNVAQGNLAQEQWHCEQGTSWPKEVVAVEVVKIEKEFYAVGKDERGKVRKPSNYKSVDLEQLLNR